MAEAVFKVMLPSITGNHENQMHIANCFPTILSHVTDQEIAVLCVLEMFRNNLPMLQTKVKKREIDIMVKLLVENDMSVTFLRLVRSTLSCPNGVDSTQGMVTANLLEHLVRKSETISSVDKEIESASNANERDRASITASTASLSDVSLSKASNELDSVVSIKKSVSVEFLPVRLKLAADSEAGELKWKKENFLILLSSDDISSKIPWPVEQENIYFPNNQVKMANIGKIVMGYRVYSEGIFKIWLRWRRADSDQFSMMSTFGFDDYVELKLLCNALLPNQSDEIGSDSSTEVVTSPTPKNVLVKNADFQNRKTQINRSNKATFEVSGQKSVADFFALSAKERRIQIAECFPAQLYLAADLCLDRQYNAIQALEKIYNYDTLVCLLNSSDAANAFKAPACRLLRTLFVDREPQATVKYPKLIRTSINEVLSQLKSSGSSKSRSIRFTDDEEEDGSANERYKFALLQSSISKYISVDFDPRYCDELSVEIVKMLQNLIDFGFYQTSEQLEDVTIPLIDVLGCLRDPSAFTNRKKGIKSRLRVQLERSETAEKGGLCPGGIFLQIKLFLLSSVAECFCIKKTDNDKFSRRPVDLWGITRNFLFGSSAISAHNREKKFKARRLLDLNKQDHNLRRKLRGEISDSHQRTLRQKQHMWEARLLLLLEGIVAMSVILALVLISSIISFLYSVGDLKTMDEAENARFDFAFSTIFLIEVCSRYFCHIRVFQKLFLFLNNPYNLFDVLVVTMDWVLQSMQDDNMLSGNVTQTRVIRFVRLVRLFRAARLLKRLHDEAREKRQWKIPARHLKAITESEAQSLVGILQILNMVFDRVQDKQLGVRIVGFLKWYDLHGSELDGIESREVATEMYKNAKEENSNPMSIIPSYIDEVVLDICMYNEPTLLQAALTVLMTSRSNDRLLHDISMSAQIIYSRRVLDKYNKLKVLIRDLRSFAEKFEVWGDMESDEDSATAAKMLQSLEETTSLIKVIVKGDKRKSFGLRLDYVADNEVQLLLYNMDAISCFMAIHHALHDPRCYPGVNLY